MIQSTTAPSRAVLSKVPWPATEAEDLSNISLTSNGRDYVLSKGREQLHKLLEGALPYWPMSRLLAVISGSLITIQVTIANSTPLDPEALSSNDMMSHAAISRYY